jgi:hypothetical protein
MNYETFRSLLGEGFHTALRKEGESVAADWAWRSIRDMPRDEWGRVLDFVARPTWEYLITDPPPHPEEETQ